MDEMEFHTKRRMWAYDHKDGITLLAESEDWRSHYAWLTSFYGLALVRKEFDNIVRGYYLDGKLVAYRGHTFSHQFPKKVMVQVLQDIERFVGPVHTLGFGATPSDEIPWPCKKIVKKEDFLRTMSSLGKK